MKIAHRELPTAKAAILILGNLEKQLRDVTTPLKMLNEAILPVFGIRSDLQVIRRIGSTRLCKILWSLRNSKLPLRDYNRIFQLGRNGTANDTTFPTVWGSWRSLIERFNLGDELPLGEWLKIVDTAVKQGWGEPSQLAQVDHATFSAVATCHALPPLAIQLWKAAILVSPDASIGQTMVLTGASADAETLIKKLKLATWKVSSVRRDVASSLRELRLGRDFSTWARPLSSRRSV